MDQQTTGKFAKDIEHVFGQIHSDVTAIYAGLVTGPALPQVVKFYKIFDALSSESSQATACKPGCTYCCHYHIMVSATEVFALAESIGQLPSEVREIVTQRVHQVAQKAKSMTRETYIRTNVECAMLLDGKCSVYTGRPIACRGHHSLNVKVCKDTFDDVFDDSMAPKDYHREVMFHAFANAQLEANYRLKVDTSKYEMHAALSLALSDPACFKRWKMGEAAFPGVADKVSLEEMIAGQ